MEYIKESNTELKVVESIETVHTLDKLQQKKDFLERVILSQEQELEKVRKDLADIDSLIAQANKLGIKERRNI